LKAIVRKLASFAVVIESSIAPGTGGVQIKRQLHWGRDGKNPVLTITKSNSR
jgi:hypothetical protein